MLPGETAPAARLGLELIDEGVAAHRPAGMLGGSRASLNSSQVCLRVDVADLSRMLDRNHPRERDAKIPDQL